MTTFIRKAHELGRVIALLRKAGATVTISEDGTVSTDASPEILESLRRRVPFSLLLTVPTAEELAAALAAQKERRILQMNQMLVKYLDSHYDPPRRELLKALLDEAYVEDYKKRIKYLAPAFDWVKSVMTYFYGQSALVNAAKDKAGIDAVPFDLPGELDESDPQVTAEKAMGMT